MIPIITGAKYESKKGKLAIKEERFAQDVILLVDSQQIPFSYSDGVLVAKELNLGPGIHTIQVIKGDIESPMHSFQIPIGSQLGHSFVQTAANRCD